MQRMGSVPTEARGSPRILQFSMGIGDIRGFVAIDATEDEACLGFGGLRIAPTVDEALVSALARCMTAKYRIHGLPIRGAKAGISATPSEGCRPEVAAAFARGASGVLSQQLIVGKDMGATDDFLDAVYDALGAPQLELARQQGFAGNPDRVRSLTGYRKHMTGLGVAWSTDAALRWRGGSAAGARVLVQGAGRVGLGSAVRLAELGARIVGISDRRLAVAHPDGLPIGALSAAINASGDLDPARLNAPHQVLPSDDLLGLDADVLVLAADSRIVTGPLADTVRAWLLVEGANFPCTPEGEAALHAAGRLLLPDAISSSSSAALVGHQICTGNQQDPDIVWAGIEAAIRRVTHETLSTARPGETLRAAFYRNLELADA